MYYSLLYLIMNWNERVLQLPKHLNVFHRTEISAVSKIGFSSPARQDLCGVALMLWWDPSSLSGEDLRRPPPCAGWTWLWFLKGAPSVVGGGSWAGGGAAFWWAVGSWNQNHCYSNGSESWRLLLVSVVLRWSPPDGCCCARGMVWAKAPWVPQDGSGCMLWWTQVENGVSLNSASCLSGLTVPMSSVIIVTFQSGRYLFFWELWELEKLEQKTFKNTLLSVLPDLRAKLHWQPDYGGFVRILTIYLIISFTSTGFPLF